MASKGALDTRSFASEPPLEAAQALRKAIASYKKGEWADAAVAAASAAETHARYAEAYHLLALALDNLGQHTKAFEMFERALSLSPAKASLLFDLGNAAAKLQRFDAAEIAYRA
jgi:Flp pilus assembly protein TadD